MQITDTILEYARQMTANFKYPFYLWGILILFVVLLFLITRSFVRFTMDEESTRKLRRIRVLVFIMRFLAMSMLIIALATPFTELTKETQGNPHAVILVDKSGSMDNYDTSFVPQLTKGLSAQMPTSVKEFGSSTDSPVGDAILGQDAHVLVVSDGNANSGVALLDVAQVMQENNLSINAIQLSPVKSDAAVYIDAPDSLPLGFPATINVVVSATDGKQVPLTVLVDGKQVYAGAALGTQTFTPALSSGYHKIEAHIASKDANGNNNDFYRVIQVLEKPKVLVVAPKTGALEQALSGMFDTTVVGAMPTNPSTLSQYYAIVADDVPASQMGSTNTLADFLRDDAGGHYGNGLVVVGGFNSYDRGSYGGTQLEGLLPVKIGKPKRSLGENNIVFVIQVSGSTGGTKFDVNSGQSVTEDTPTIDTIKAQAVSAINSLNLKNNVGVVAFGVVPQDAASCQGKDESCVIGMSVVKIADIKPLYSSKKDLLDKIPRINGGGTTAPDIALKTAVDMLKDKSGDKTIILLTNGRFCAGLGACAGTPAFQNVETVVQNSLKRYNIKTQTIGVGSTDDAIFAKKVDEVSLKDIAQVGDSTYDRATNMASLIVKYGDPKEKGFGDAFSLVPLSLTHFITKDVNLDATLNGYNEVSPKDGSRMLVSTDSGYPALTIWNYFNGRVAALTVFTASGIGPLLQGNNSDLVRNTVLWAVGDPQRKLDVTSKVQMGIVNHKTEITFVSKQPITGNCPDTQLSFDRNSGDTYIFTFTPTRIGFGSACGVPYAVNGESEYWKVGLNPDLQNAVGITGGGTFTFDQIDQIVDKIKTVSTHTVTEKTDIRNPFIFFGVLLFLMEIFMRRFLNKRG